MTRSKKKKKKRFWNKRSKGKIKPRKCCCWYFVLQSINSARAWSTTLDAFHMVAWISGLSILIHTHSTVETIRQRVVGYEDNDMLPHNWENLLRVGPYPMRNSDYSLCLCEINDCYIYPFSIYLPGTLNLVIIPHEGFFNILPS